MRDEKTHVIVSQIQMNALSSHAPVLGRTLELNWLFFGQDDGSRFGLFADDLVQDESTLPISWIQCDQNGT